MPDFGKIAGLLGNVKSIFDFIAGTTGSLAGFGTDKGAPALIEGFLGSSAATETTL